MSNVSDYPKVLVIGETFNYTDGGGITLSNLFKDWPINKIANAIDSNRVFTITSFEICENVYSLGNKEKKALFPFSFLRGNDRSGKLSNPPLKIIQNKKNSIFFSKVKDKLRSILHLTGIYHFLFKIELSNEFLTWVNEFEPEVIYCQFNTIETLKFVEKLTIKLKKKYVVHMMDDWPSTVIKKGLLFKYWRNILNNKLINVFRNAETLLSISDGMSMEYKNRYNMIFLPFHNPIAVDYWVKHKKTKFSYNKQFKILYAGRVGVGTSSSLLDIANSIVELNANGIDIVFEIMTSNSNSDIISSLSHYEFVEISQPVLYNQLPVKFSNSDLLVLPYDFDEHGYKFIKYSMPTKASEYMISATPILLYANRNSFIFEHAKKFEWAFAVSDRMKLSNSILSLIKNEDERIRISKNAFDYSFEHFDSNKIRTNFHKIFQNIKL